MGRVCVGFLMHLKSESLPNDNWRPKVNYNFDSVWSNNLDNIQYTFVMEQQVDNDLGLKDANVKLRRKTTDNVNKSFKCNQCDYAASKACHLKEHLKTHSGEKSNKCKQCDYASSLTGNLRRHLKIHNGEE